MIYEQVKEEVKSAREKYPAFHSTHEGFAVIKEEVDELWDFIKATKFTGADDSMKAECIQIAAMAIRFIEDLYK